MITKTRPVESPQEKVTDDGMAALQAAAEAKDELAFLTARKAIDWAARPAEDFVHAVQLALMAGAFVAARNLAAEGAERYSDHAELQKMAYILAPPKVTVVKGKTNTTWKADRAWLKTHWDAYRGHWVALRNGELLGAADSLDGLVDQVGEIRGKGILVTPIW